MCPESVCVYTLLAVVSYPWLASQHHMSVWWDVATCAAAGGQAGISHHNDSFVPMCHACNPQTNIHIWSRCEYRRLYRDERRHNWIHVLWPAGWSLWLNPVLTSVLGSLWLNSVRAGGVYWTFGCCSPQSPPAVMHYRQHVLQISFTWTFGMSINEWMCFSWLSLVWLQKDLLFDTSLQPTKAQTNGHQTIVCLPLMVPEVPSDGTLDDWENVCKELKQLISMGILLFWLIISK